MVDWHKNILNRDLPSSLPYFDLAATFGSSAARVVWGYDLPSLPLAALDLKPSYHYKSAFYKDSNFNTQTLAHLTRTASLVALDTVYQPGIKANTFTGKEPVPGMTFGTLLYFGHLGAGLSHAISITASSRAISDHVFWGQSNLAAIGHNALGNFYSGYSLYDNVAQLLWAQEAQDYFLTLNELKAQAFIEQNGLPAGVDEEEATALLVSAFEALEAGDSSSDVDLRVLASVYGTDVTAFEALMSSAKIQQTATSTLQSTNQIEALTRFINIQEIRANLIALSTSHRSLLLSLDAYFDPNNELPPTLLVGATLASPLAVLGTQLSLGALRDAPLTGAEIALPLGAHLLLNGYGLLGYSLYQDTASLIPARRFDKAANTVIGATIHPQAQALLAAVSPNDYGQLLPTNAARTLNEGLNAFGNFSRTLGATKLMMLEDGFKYDLPALINYSSVLIELGATYFVATPNGLKQFDNYDIDSFDPKNVWAPQAWGSFAFSTSAKGLGFLIGWGAAALDKDKAIKFASVIPDSVANPLSLVLEGMTFNPTFNQNKIGISLGFNREF